jgi:glycosyltransferase involved in cell wall biosynthesis
MTAVSNSRDRDSVSVVIGAYNAGAWIGQALDSVLAQTYPVLEVLVIDDGSTDDTPHVVRSFGTRVQYAAEQHRGRPHRNRGILASRGDIVAFLDADDYWSPVKLERQVELLRTRRVPWAVSESAWLDDAAGTMTPPAGMAIREGDIPEAVPAKPLLHSLIVRRAVLDESWAFR